MNSVDRMLGYDDEYKSTDETRKRYMQGWGTCGWAAGFFLHPGTNWLVSMREPFNFPERVTVILTLSVISNAMNGPNHGN